MTLMPPKGRHIRAIIEKVHLGGRIADRVTLAEGIFYHVRQ